MIKIKRKRTLIILLLLSLVVVAFNYFNSPEWQNRDVTERMKMVENGESIEGIEISYKSEFHYKVYIKHGKLTNSQIRKLCYNLKEVVDKRYGETNRSIMGTYISIIYKPHIKKSGMVYECQFSADYDMETKKLYWGYHEDIEDGN